MSRHVRHPGLQAASAALAKYGLIATVLVAGILTVALAIATKLAATPLILAELAF